MELVLTIANFFWDLFMYFEVAVTPKKLQLMLVGVYQRYVRETGQKPFDITFKVLNGREGTPKTLVIVGFPERLTSIVLRPYHVSRARHYKEVLHRNSKLVGILYDVWNDFAYMSYPKALERILEEGNKADVHKDKDIFDALISI